MSRQELRESADSSKALLRARAAMYDAAVAHHNAGQMAEAYALYRKVLDTDPDHADSLHMMGVMALQIGQTDSALDFISRAIELKNGDFLYHNDLGLVFFSLGRLDEALECFGQATRLQDDYQAAYRNLARTLRRQGKTEEAFEQYERALAAKPNDMMLCDFRADGLGTLEKSLKFMDAAVFKDAWRAASETALSGWSAGAPDVRWRVHVAIWAAQNGLRLEGDFVECGVNTALLSISICNFVDFAAQKDKTFWLFDTWGGIPLEGLTEAEKMQAEKHNANYYQSDKIHDAVEQAFSKFPNSRMVRGALPGTLQQADIKKIAYLSVDLNGAAAEKGCIEILWPKLTPGAFVVIDDYGWTPHREQQDMWDEFAAAHDRSIVTLPTGQGLLVK